MDNYNYPEGADTKDAPWNQCDPPTEKIDVVVTLTISKRFTIDTTGCMKLYSDDPEEYGYYTEYDMDAIRSDIRDQVVFPTEVCDIKDPDVLGKVLEEDCKDWCIEDFDFEIE